MDLQGQLASVWLRRRTVLGGAVAVALVVLVVRLLTPPVYAAQETVRVDVPSTTGAERSEAVAFAAQTVVGVAGTDAVLADAGGRAGLPPGAAEVADRVRVTAAESAGFLTVEATAPTPAGAALLARSLTAALTDRLAQDNRTAVASATAPLREQLAELEGQLAAAQPGSVVRTGSEQRYAALVGAVTEIESRPGPTLIPSPPGADPTDPVSPVPVRDALLALVVALIVLAEGVVVVRALRGRLPEADPAARVTREVDLPTVVLDAAADLETALVPLHRRLREARTTTVVQLAPGGAVDVGAALAGAAALAGDDRAHVPPGAGAPADRAPADRGAVDRGAVDRGAVDRRAVVRSLRAREVDAAVLRAVAAEPGPVLLALDTATARASRLAADVAALRAVGADVVAVLVWRGRFPRAGATRRAPAGGGTRTPEPAR